MKLTRIDLNSWIFHVGGKTVLVDPWLVDPMAIYGMPWLFAAYHNQPVAFTPETLPPIDLILLSQGLDDHCHKPTLERLDRNLPVVASATAAKVARSLGYSQVTALNPWQNFTVGNLEITALPGAEIQPGQIENGYRVQDLSTGEALYYEPHWTPTNAITKETLGKLDVALTPVVGQIFPLLGQVIMGPDQALNLVETLNPRYVVPTTLGDIRATGILPGLIKTVGSVEEFHDRLIASGLPTELRLPAPGETITLA